jgi:hypothetical protein
VASMALGVVIAPKYAPAAQPFRTVGPESLRQVLSPEVVQILLERGKPSLTAEQGVALPTIRVPIS